MNKDRSLIQIVVEDVFNSIYDSDMNLEEFIEEKSYKGEPDHRQIIKIIILLVKRISDIDKFLKTN